MLRSDQGDIVVSSCFSAYLSLAYPVSLLSSQYQVCFMIAAAMFCVDLRFPVDSYVQSNVITEIGDTPIILLPSMGMSSRVQMSKPECYLCLLSNTACEKGVAHLYITRARESTPYIRTYVQRQIYITGHPHWWNVESKQNIQITQRGGGGRNSSYNIKKKLT